MLLSDIVGDNIWRIPEFIDDSIVLNCTKDIVSVISNLNWILCLRIRGRLLRLV